MTTAVFTARLDTTPHQVVVNGKEQLQAHASINIATQESLPIVVRAWISSKGTGPAPRLQAKNKEDLVLISGNLQLGDKGTDEDGCLIMNLATICDATQDQFINDATIVGRLGNDPKASDSGKSVSNSIAVNRWIGKDNKLTDWFKIRGWGYNGEKLQEKFPKGSLVAVNGMIEARRTRQDKLYPELKIRNLTIHASGKGGSAPDPSKESSASGYDHDQFTGQSPVGDMPQSSSWS